MTCDVLAAPDIVEVPLHVAQHDEIEQAIVIEVHPGCGRRPTAAAGAGALRDIGEGSVSVVVIEMVAAEAGYIEIVVSVIVVVADSYAHVVSDTLKASLLRYILKGSVRLLMVEAVPILRAGLLRDRSLGRGIAERRSVGEEDVESAVVVVVEESDAGSHGFDQIFFVGVRGLCQEVDVALLRDVDEVAGNDLRRFCRVGV